MQSISLCLMCTKAITFDTLCTGRDTHQERIRLSDLSIFASTSLFAIDVRWRRLTQCDNKVDEHTTWRHDKRYQSNRHWLTAPMPKTKYRLIVKQWRQSNTECTKLWEELVIWNKISKYLPKNTVYRKRKSPYFTVRNDSSGLTETMVAKSPGWSETTLR